MIMSVNQNLISLHVEGVLYAGWESVSVTRSMDALCGSFELSVTDPWELGAEPWPIYPGQSAQVMIGGDTVITGWVDKVSVSLDAHNHSISVSGRDLTCDIVDCSAVNNPGQWNNMDIEAIAQAICAPYGVEVVCDVDTGEALQLFRIQHGENALEAIDRMCKGAGLILTGTPLGQVHITSVSTVQVPISIVEGKNLLSITHDVSQEKQFSNYEVDAFAMDSKHGGAYDPTQGATITR